jgi:hypothetical protein
MPESYRTAIIVPILQSLWLAIAGLPLITYGLALAGYSHPIGSALLLDGCLYWLVQVMLFERVYGMLSPWLPTPSTPAPIPQLFSAQIIWDGGKAGVWADLDVPRDWLVKWARGVLRGVPLAESIWAGASREVAGGPHKPSVREYRAFLATLRASDWELVEWANERAHAQGMRLTEKGQRVVAEWAQYQER